jgi:uridylate kinase
MADRKYERVLLKISGEGLCRKGGFGIDGEQLDKIAGELKSVVETGVQLALVVGGGNFIRGDDLAKISQIPRATGHYMGMLGTVINALAVQETLERFGLETRVQSAIAVDRVCEKFIRRRAIRHLEKNRVVILAYDEVIDRRLKIMDVSAIDLCQQSELPILVFNLGTPGNMLKAIQGLQVGTLITVK